jgi:hypothetical protein
MAEPSVTIHPSTIDASTPVALRGDPITGDAARAALRH